VSPLVWLAVAGIAAVAAYLVGWPAWQSRRRRIERETNTERYLAWRGRGRERPPGGEGPTPDEQRRLLAGAALGVLALAAVIGFFATS
jgi:hypothetical protein